MIDGIHKPSLTLHQTLNHQTTKPLDRQDPQSMGQAPTAASTKRRKLIDEIHKKEQVDRRVKQEYGSSTNSGIHKGCCHHDLYTDTVAPSSPLSPTQESVPSTTLLHSHCTVTAFIIHGWIQDLVIYSHMWLEWGTLPSMQILKVSQKKPRRFLIRFEMENSWFLKWDKTQFDLFWVLQVELLG